MNCQLRKVNCKQITVHYSVRIMNSGRWTLRNTHAYGTFWPSFQSPFLENMGVVLNNKEYQMIELFHKCQLLRVLWGKGGWWPPYWIYVGVIACGDLFSIHLYFFLTILKHICLIHRILNERKTSNLGQDFLYLYKNKEIYMYWVLLVVLLDLWQGLIVLKSSLFSIIWQFVGHGGEHFCLGVLRGWWHVGVIAPCGVLPSNWGWVSNYAIHSSAVDTSFDTRFEFNKFLWGPKGGKGGYVYFT